MNKRPKDKPRFKDVFNRFDVDGTGVIDASELRQGLVGFG
jgi:Ca2+-binding EF-hand superfamily protein